MWGLQVSLFAYAVSYDWHKGHAFKNQHAEVKVLLPKKSEIASNV